MEQSLLALGWPGGNSSPLVGGTSPTQTPPKLHSVLHMNPTVGLFQTVISAAQWISPQTKQPMKVIITSREGELVQLLEPICLARQLNHSVGARKM